MAIRVFLGGLKFEVSQRGLAAALVQLVPGWRPVQLQIWRKGQYSQSSTCCAFITVESREHGLATIAALNGRLVPGLGFKPLRAEWAVPRMSDIQHKAAEEEVAKTDEYELHGTADAGTAAEDMDAGTHEAKAEELAADEAGDAKAEASAAAATSPTSPAVKSDSPSMATTVMLGDHLEERRASRTRSSSRRRSRTRSRRSRSSRRSRTMPPKRRKTRNPKTLLYPYINPEPYIQEQQPTIEQDKPETIEDDTPETTINPKP